MQLRRLRTGTATYYNVQRRKHRPVPGTYRWYVWAGSGLRAARKYSPLLGSASFTVTP